MGQYYNPLILRKNWKLAKNPVIATLKCYDFNGNGAKLMEHSYAGNSFARSVEYLLANQFKGYPFVWCGDYYEPVTTNTGEHYLYSEGNRFIYKSDESNDPTKAYKKLKGSIPAMPEWKEGQRWNAYETIPYYRYLINYTKKQFCRMPMFNKKKWRVNPLPLLTCAGNGLGGGDYRRDDKRVGSWAFDCIGLTNSKKEIAGFEEIDGFFEMD